ncbi:hypothetical protein HDV00_001266 [Rhizophlyctis rosea]|nr:hypothetical protein HDV00_001266 [Rhizophlyctis rosea]
MFSLWSMVAHTPSYDGLFIELFSSLAEKQVGAPENVQWSESQIRHMFSVGLRSFELPVGGTGDSRGPGGGMRMGTGNTFLDLLDAGRKNKTIEAFAKFIVYTIYPPSVANGGLSYPSRSMEHLATMIRSIESYFHPSNSGRWTYQLARFIQVLSSEFLRRLRKEEQPDCKTPGNLRITRAQSEEFVLTIRGVALSAMFGKDQIAVLSIHGALKCLAWIQPKLIIPALLERIYPALETLTETHRTLTSLGTLWGISIPLLNRRHFPQGGQHLPNLLELTLPGIDLNDPGKTSAALMFVTHAAMCAPLFDLTKGHRGAGGDPVAAHSNAMLEVDAGVGDMDVDLDEEDEACRLATAQFEEWAAKFLDRIFVLFENLPQQHGSAATNRTMETSLIQLVMYACEIVFVQMSPDLQEVSMRKVLNFVSSNVVPNATKAIGTLSNLVGGGNSSKKLAAFIPLCHANILSELKNGAASDAATTAAATSNPFGFASMGDATLHWWQAIFFNVIAQNGSETLKYRSEVMEILTASVETCRSKRGYKWAGKALRYSLYNLTATYPLELRSHGNTRWHDPEFINNSHKYWGEAGNPRELDMDWHVPTDEEVQWALDIVESFVPQCIQKLRSLLTPASTMDTRQISSEFSKWLALLRNLVIGSSTLAPPETAQSDASSNDEDPFVPHAKKRPVAAGYCITDPQDPRYGRVQAIRTEVGQVLHEVAVYLQAQREDDTEAIHALVKCIKFYLTFRGNDRSKYDGIFRGYKYAKSAVKSVEEGKRLPRYLLVKRVHLLHLCRLKYNSSQSVRSEVVITLMDDIANLSVGKYSRIRKAAQSALSRATRCFPSEKYRLFPRFIANLEPGSDGLRDPDKMKGALYVLKSSGFLSIALRDWKHAAMLMETLSKAQHEDKPSVLELIRKVFLEYLMQASEISIGLLVTDGIAQRAKAFHDGSAQGDEVQAKRAKVEQKAIKSRESYHRLMDSLLALLHGNTLHWRFAAMTVNFIDLILRADEPIPSSLTQFVADGIVSEHPAMRKVCLVVLTRMLIVMKARAVAAIGDGGLKQQLEMEGAFADNFVQQYLETGTRPVTRENWDSTYYVDSLCAGWYCWPSKTLKAYRPGNDIPESQLRFYDASSAESYTHLASTFAAPEFWTKFLSYESQETSRGPEMYNVATAKFYKYVFTLFLDIPMEPFRAAVLPLSEKTNEKSLQRAAAEALGGLIRGAKHWDHRRQAALWDWVAPVVERALAAANQESLVYWAEFIKFSGANRDPRRVFPIVQMVLDAPLDPHSQSFFAESKKLALKRALLGIFSWRLLPLTSDLLRSYMAAINHPYQQVREALGGNINEILQLQWHPSARNVSESIRRSIENARAAPENVGEVPIEPTQEIQALLSDLTRQLQAWMADRPTTNVGGTDYGNAGKTVLAWKAEAVVSHRVSGTYPIIRYIMPEVFLMQDWEDQDLQKMAQSVASVYPQLPHTRQMIPQAIQMLVSVLRNDSNGSNNGGESATTRRWHVKARVLPVLQVFFFKHLHLLSTDLTMVVMDTVSGLLKDPQVEVRQLASVTLSGLIRCSQRDAIDALKERFESELAAAPLPKRRRTAEGMTPVPTDTIVKRHAAVLGLSSLIQAFPYEVPKWMPETLVILAKCVSDPNPIAPTVSKTFADFRRTHQDNWHEDMREFTEDQLYLLSDLLISPSYYA